jgi:hypothetical protein
MFNSLHPDHALQLAADRRRRIELDFHRVRLPRRWRRTEPISSDDTDGRQG